MRISVDKFSEQASNLLNSIKGESGVFSIPETQEFLDSIFCTSIKAKSTQKTDIRIFIHDQRINQIAELGFSIKSQLGGDSTLLNAGKTTNFIYKINDILIPESEINRINQINSHSKIKDRIIALSYLGGRLQFSSLERPVFKNNLVLIDSLLPEILSELVLTYYTSSFSSITDLCKEISKKNPLNFDTQFSHTFYEYKIKRFLTDVALGMMPSKVWAGRYDATGGYLIIKENGDVLCYHLYNKNLFEDYLFENTKLDTASSSKHDFGYIERIGQENCFKLNLQIRFK